MNSENPFSCCNQSKNENPIRDLTLIFQNYATRFSIQHYMKTEILEVHYYRSIFVIFVLPRAKKEMISWCTFRPLVKKLVFISSIMSKSVFCVLSAARLNSESLSTWDHSYITLAKRLGGWVAVGRRIL